MPPKKYCAAKRRNLEVWALVIFITLRRGSRARNAFVETARLFRAGRPSKSSVYSPALQGWWRTVEPRGRAPGSPGNAIPERTYAAAIGNIAD
jgi:hypothetical protein